MNTPVCLLLAALLIAGCTSVQRDASAREWARSECNRVIDAGDRERCMKRAEETYGSGTAERRDPPKR